jgi:hypothetical protein
MFDFDKACSILILCKVSTVFWDGSCLIGLLRILMSYFTTSIELSPRFSLVLDIKLGSSLASSSILTSF